MTSLYLDLFGEMPELIYTLPQLFLRTFVVYIITIILIRIGNKRFIGEHTAIDFILAVVIGSIMSRIIVEKFTLLNGIIIAFFLVSLHSIFAKISYYSDTFGRLVKGRKRVLIENGEINQDNLRKSSLSNEDLLSALRRDGNTQDVQDVKLAYLERNGKISVIKRRGERE